MDYCQLPDASTSQQVRPFLHAGIDTQILEKLKKEECPEITASSIQEIDHETYQVLQLAVTRQIEKEEEFHGLLPVHYDNIMFLRLNPRKAAGKVSTAIKIAQAATGPLPEGR